mmetsp:Transcript_23333/g.59575  ORF Transcript_23333/g.59575 Transcript_23333/m.59575 type:complete len:649 (+) Transcript_23333:1716-3662(+)
MLHPPRADAQRVQRIVLQACGHDQVVVGQQGAVVQDAAALVAVDLHHAAVQDAHPELQHDAPQLVVRVGGRACHERQMVRVVVLEATRRQERQRVEEQVWDAQQALQEGQAAVAGAHDDDARVYRDLRLAQELLGHDGEGLGLGRVAQQIVPNLLSQFLPRRLHPLHVDEGGHLRRLPQHFLQLRWAPWRHLQHLPEDRRDRALQLRLHEEHRAAHEAHGALVQPARVLLEERVDDPVHELRVALVLAPLVVLHQQVVVQVVAAPQRVHGVLMRHLQHEQPDHLLVELGHEAVLLLALNMVRPRRHLVQKGLQAGGDLPLQPRVEVLEERQHLLEVRLPQVAHLRRPQQRRAVDEVEHVAKRVLRLRGDDGERVQEGRVGRGVRLGDDAVVLLGEEREGRQEEVERLRLVGLVQAAHVDAEHVLGVLRHVGQPARRVRVPDEEALVGLDHLIEGALEAILGQDGQRIPDVLVRPPMERHDELGEEFLREGPALLHGERLQEDHGLDGRAALLAVGPCQGVLVSRLALVPDGIRRGDGLPDEREDLGDLLPLLQHRLGDLAPGFHVERHERLHAVEDPLGVDERLLLVPTLQEVHLPEQRHHALVEGLQGLADLVGELLGRHGAEELRSADATVLVARVHGLQLGLQVD